MIVVNKKSKTQDHSTLIASLFLAISLLFLFAWIGYITATMLPDRLGGSLQAVLSTPNGQIYRNEILTYGPIYIASIFAATSLLYIVVTKYLQKQMHKKNVVIWGTIFGVVIGTIISWQVLGYFFKG